MGINIVLVLFSCAALTSANSYHQPSPWWAKPITPDLSTAGCLTKSQIQEAKDAGFNSIVSMFNSATEEHMGGQEYPSTSQEESTVRQLGMDYEVILNPDEFDWMTISALERFGAVYPRLRKPVLFHCVSSYSATFISLLYLVNSTRQQTLEEAVTMDAVGMLTQTTSMGFDYTMDEAPLKMLREVSGIEDLQMDNTPELSNPYWNFGFWPMKPIIKNWYLIGQLHPSLLQTAKDNGIDMVIHVESGTITQPTGSNIDQTTFSGTLLEEKDAQTQAPRPDSRRMECTETGGSPHDHPHVPGHVDELAAKVGITYWNLGIDELNASVWLELRPKLLKVASQHSGILVHGDSTQNTVLLVLLAAGCQHGRDSTWARQVIRRHGYFLDKNLTDAGETNGSMGHFISQLRQWSPLLADFVTPLAELVGVHQVTPNVNNIQADDILTTVLDHRDAMC